MGVAALRSALFVAALAVCVGCHTDGQCTRDALAGGKVPSHLADLANDIDAGTVHVDVCKTLASRALKTDLAAVQRTKGAEQVDGRQWTIMFRRGVLQCSGTGICSAPSIRGIDIRVVGAEPRLHVANVVLTPNQIGPLLDDDRVRYIEPNCTVLATMAARRPPNHEAAEVAGTAAPAVPQRTPERFRQDGCDPGEWNIADTCVSRTSQPDRTGATVAVLDSGLDCVNPAIHERIDDGEDPTPPRRCTQGSGKNYLYPKLPPDNCDGAQSPKCAAVHGSQVAGVIASNAAKVPGMDPAAKLVSMRVLDARSDPGFGVPLTTVATAILDSGDERSRIINISANWYMNHPWLAAAIDAVTADGMHLVVAAAREGYGRPAYPAAFTTCNDAVIGVSGIWKEDGASRWWRYRWINLTEHNEEYMAAPGGVIRVLDPSDPNGTWKNGTSFAAPHVSGAASLVWSAKEFESCNAVGVRELLECSARVTAIGADQDPRKRLHLGCLFGQRDSPICRGARRCIESAKEQYCR